MNPLRLLIATGLLAALGAGVWWSNRTKDAEKDKAPKDAAPKILSTPEDQVQKIEFLKKDEPPTIVERSGDNKWKITAPKPLPVDQDAMSSILSNIASLSSDRQIEGPEDPASYGLQPPQFTLAVSTKDGKTQKVEVGEDSPVGSSVYVRLAGDPRIFTMSSYNKTSLVKTWKDLRDKRLMIFDSEKVSRVELSAKKQNLEFGRLNQNEWQVLKPRPLRADGWQVEELVRKLKDAKMDTSASDEDAKKFAAAFASGTPIAIAKITDPTGTQQIEVRKSKDDYYAKSSTVEGVWKIQNDLGTGVDKGLDDFRNKKLFDFGFSDPSKVEIRDGGTFRSFQKSGDKWTLNGKTMDNTSVQAFIDKVRDLQALKFPETGFGAADVEVTVVSSEGKRTEKVLISGKIAKRENEPALYELDQVAVDELKRSASDVKEPPPPSADKSGGKGKDAKK